MKMWVCILGLWLVGIGHVVAMDVRQPEVLRYRVSWGPLGVGDANITYNVEGDSYVVRAEVKDETPLLELNDVWESRGQHTRERVFVPDVYHVVQAENDYRADKTMTFDHAADKVVYENRRDASDKAEPLPMSEARDVLATVFAWRVKGEADVTQGEQVPLVSLKKTILLERKPGVKSTLRIRGEDMPVWKVDLRTIKDGKSSKDSWTVYVTRDDAMVPVKILARTKFGTFAATLKK